MYSGALRIDQIFVPGAVGQLSPVSPGARSPVELPVKTSHVKTHLSLLRSFYALRSRVENIHPQQLPGIRFLPHLPERRWSWCVGLAVERFERWCWSLKEEDEQRPLIEILPPVDALMVWHTYLLNPLWYYEDALRISEISLLRKIGRGLLDVLSTYFVDDLMHYPSETRLREWTERTGTSWDLIQSIPELQYKSLKCPKCQNPMLVPFMSDTGVGYLQHGFLSSCSRCSRMINKSVLAANKFAEDLTLDDFCLPGTRYTPNPNEIHSKGNALQTKEKILQAEPFRRPAYYDKRNRRHWLLQIMEGVGYSIEGTKDRLSAALKSKEPVRRIIKAYQDDRLFSVDLVGSVLRQSSFVEKVHGLGWTAVEDFEANEDKLRVAIKRYDKFLLLCRRNTNKSLVPTLDIDLVWHTHQMMSTEYQNYCMDTFQRFLDHQDKVEEDILSKDFDSTKVLWKQDHDTSYTQCGCPEAKSGGMFSGRKSTKGQAQPETHPSDHDKFYDFSKDADEFRDKHIHKHTKNDPRHPIPFVTDLPPTDAYSPADCTAISGHIMMPNQKLPGSNTSVYSVSSTRSKYSRPTTSSGHSVRSSGSDHTYR